MFSGVSPILMELRRQQWRAGWADDDEEDRSLWLDFLNSLSGRLWS
jgi:hypothetical protein